MTSVSRRTLVRALLAAVVAVAGRTAHAQPKDYTAADVRFMQGMIAHHGQAIAMAALVPSRTQRADMKLLAERIDVSQKDEIATMRQWLAARHETVPGADAPMHHGMPDMPAMAGMDMSHDSTMSTLMPGMLTPAQMQQLAAASGTEFDRLFLTGMIRHHEGALQMVKDLFATPGAGQEPNVFRFASDVDTDQRVEIARMQQLLAALPNR